MRGIVLAMMLVLVSCGGAVGYDAEWPVTSDKDAIAARVLMDHTVMVEVTMALDVSGLRDILEDSYPPDGIVKVKSSGSGVVLMIEDGQSLVVSADHVCDREETVKIGPFELPVRWMEFNTVSTSGKRTPAWVITEDPEHDICAIRADGVVGTVSPIAHMMPPVGARVVHVGAPAGTFGKHLATIVDGRYSGLSVKRGVAYATHSFAVAPGSSGGAMFYKGSLYGLVTMCSVQNCNVAWGVELDHVRTTFIEARNKWHNGLGLGEGDAARD